MDSQYIRPIAGRVKLQPLCSLQDIDPDSGKEVLVQDGDGRQYIALFRQGDAVKAYLNSCPHQGRSLNWAPDQFLIDKDGTLVCPHHGACFEISSGVCVSGPCEGASLVPVEIEVRDGIIHLSENQVNHG